MAQAAKKAARTTPAKVASMGDSPLAGLASKATSASARATKADGDGKPKANYTGQYFLERFVLGDKNQQQEEKTRMDIIRKTVNELDTGSLKASLNDMIEQAKQVDIKAGIKDTEVTKSGPTYRNAANVRSIIQRIYGSLKFANEQLAKHGFTEDTGYYAAAVMSKKALTEAAVKWDGSKDKSPEEKKVAGDWRLEAEAVAKLKKANPRQPTQSLLGYETNIARMVPDEIKAIKHERAMEQVNKEVDALMLKYPHDVIKTIAEALLARLEETVTA